MERLSTRFERSTLQHLPHVSSSRNVHFDGDHENNFSRIAFEDFSPESFAERIHEELSPRSLIEEVLVDRLIAASWTLIHEDVEAQGISREARLAERSLYRTITALSQVRDRATGALSAREAHHELEPWRSRLVMDPEVSDASPVIRGTWITVDQVISRIVEGWTWDDLLRDHPELTADDIRACLAYTIEDEESR